MPEKISDRVPTDKSQDRLKDDEIVELAAAFTIR